MAKQKVKPADISGRMFHEALQRAYDHLGQNKTQLMRALGMTSRVCFQWLNGHYPPYVKMQETYYKLVAITEDQT